MFEKFDKNHMIVAYFGWNKGVRKWFQTVIISLVWVYILCLFCTSCYADSFKDSGSDSDRRQEEAAKTQGSENVEDPMTMEEGIESQGTVIASGTVNWGVRWSLDENGVLTFEGGKQIGSIDGLTEYLPQVKKIVFGNDISCVDASRPSFGLCQNLTEVVFLGESCRLGNYLFDGCHNLSKIQWPSKSCTLRDSVFLQCGFTKLELSSSIQFGYSAFANCSNLEEVDLGQNVSIGYGAFSNCRALKKVKCEGNLSIDQNAFEMCESLEEIHLPGDVSFGSGAFCGCKSLKKVSVEGQISDIGSRAFAECGNLQSVVSEDEDSVSYGCSIGESAFAGCRNLKECVIPTGVRFIGEYAFSKCAKLEVFSPFGAQTLVSVEDSDGKDSETAEESSSQMSDPKGKSFYKIEWIGDQAFFGCSDLKEVSLGETLTEFGSDVFLGCYHVREVSNTSSFVMPAAWFCDSENRKIRNTNQNKLVDTIGKGDYEIGLYLPLGGKVDPIPDQLYTGGEVKPVPIVKFHNTELIPGRDYSTSYENCKKPGLATIEIDGEGEYIGSITVTYKIVEELKDVKESDDGITVTPKQLKVKIKKIRKKKGNKIFISWKKNKYADKYRIQLADSKKFKVTRRKRTAKNRCVISVKNPKQYVYIRVRAYKKNKGGLICGPWSKVKRVKMK